MLKNKPNILFIVWDTARLDYVRSHASTLMDLGESGIWFENAIAPANWTNPSHSSMFSGMYPHEHGVTKSGYMRTRTDVFSEMRSNGYVTHSVSANNHFTNKTGFTDSVDDYHYTRYPLLFDDGIDTFDYAYGLDNYSEALVGLIDESIQNPNTLKNFMNIFPLIVNQVSKNYITQLQMISHPAFNQLSNHNNQPGRDIKKIKKLISSASADKLPHFIFNNSNHLHFPYVPSKKYQQKHLGETVNKKELHRLNYNVAQNRTFSKLVESNAVDENDIKTIRKLYAASVQEVDDYLSEVVSHLENLGMMNNTLIIITGDHGEDLGEYDYADNRRFGHGNSISNRVCRVPLVILHPDLDKEVVETPFSLKELFSIIKTASNEKETICTDDIINLCSEYVFCEFPAAGGFEAYKNKHPELSEEYIRRRTQEDFVAAYSHNERYIVGSDGTEVAFSQSKGVDPEIIPNTMVDKSSDFMKQLREYNPQTLSNESIKHLEEMGYI